ncbi:uncharacterized protein SPPG_08394 [Spizellomyces punctatus DAOM BR117]|uniref:GRF-type domain-containing protein n=1 Tax=Spizellomyces punctatus (strain DAOM BR117) TaxID=645134 RepID=A0A0L0H426_SPIPD|nr:uncharacterized protein SPPG_08394 [Spizellomyces punctatus DAOM BR117]KNC96240.1 hypothetical protein SPPG_08394 [Spizellomyces punctatus DAOM BR117]|eukprot:XP_016604280.1 hypothetical protein SPPG_08394 [Spizellomyces punctatus DAOM BR117]
MEGPPRCKCGLPAIESVVKKRTKNFGQHFWRCQNYLYKSRPCDFFQWIPAADIMSRHQPSTPKRTSTPSSSFPPQAPRKARPIRADNNFFKRPRSPSPLAPYSTKSPVPGFSALTLDGSQIYDSDASSDDNDLMYQAVSRPADQLASQMRSQDRDGEEDMMQGMEVQSQEQGLVDPFNSQPTSAGAAKLPAGASRHTGYQPAPWPNWTPQGNNSTTSTSLPTSSGLRTPQSHPRPQVETPPPSRDKSIPKQATGILSQHSIDASPSLRRHFSQQSHFESQDSQQSPDQGDVLSGTSSDSIHSYVSYLESEIRRKDRQLLALRKSKEHLQRELRTTKREADRKAKFCERCAQSL